MEDVVKHSAPFGFFLVPIFCFGKNGHLPNYLLFVHLPFYCVY